MLPFLICLNVFHFGHTCRWFFINVLIKDKRVSIVLLIKRDSLKTKMSIRGINVCFQEHVLTGKVLSIITKIGEGSLIILNINGHEGLEKDL
jgi:hypothetical protein